MKSKQFLAILVVLTIVHLSLPAPVVAAKKTREATIGMKYEGGSLPLDQHDKLNVAVNSTSVALMQGKQRFEIPAASITEISYGSDVHRRVGAAVGVGILTLGIGAMLLLVKTKKHYVGMTWAEAGSDKKGGVVFKVGKGDYRGFLAALEGITGKKAVNTDSAGPGGTSKQ